MPYYSDDDPLSGFVFHHEPFAEDRNWLYENTPPQDFLDMVGQALAEAGIPRGKITAELVNSVANTYWQSQDFKTTYESDYKNGNLSAAQFARYIRDTAFNPDENPDLAAYSLRVKVDQGGALTANQEKFLGGLDTKVPTPFDPKLFGTPSEVFGQVGPFGDREQGNDYGMDPGTQLYSPFAGTIELQDGGKRDWGYRVLVHLDNGTTFAIGHMSGFAVADGQRVNPGDLLGYSGGDASDPHSGESTGPHIEVQFLDRAGRFVDPRPMLEQIYNGTTYHQLSPIVGSNAAGEGVSSSTAFLRQHGIDPNLEKLYPGAVSLWKKYFGTQPKASDLMPMTHLGDTIAMEDYVRGLPSHISGMNMGLYFDTRTTADNESNSILGHASTDGIVRDLHNRGLATKPGVQLFYKELSWLTPQQLKEEGYA